MSTAQYSNSTPTPSQLQTRDAESHAPPPPSLATPVPSQQRCSKQGRGPKARSRIFPWSSYLPNGFGLLGKASICFWLFGFPATIQFQEQFLRNSMGCFELRSSQLPAGGACISISPQRADEAAEGAAEGAVELGVRLKGFRGICCEVFWDIKKSHGGVRCAMDVCARCVWDIKKELSSVHAWKVTSCRKRKRTWPSPHAGRRVTDLFTSLVMFNAILCKSRVWHGAATCRFIGKCRARRWPPWWIFGYR